MNAPTELRAAVAATPATPDLAAIKQRQQATWASGDYAVIGTTLQIVGENLAEAADVRAGERVLDVALSTFGAMFAPDHQRTAEELLRVVRPGGRIGFAAWTPEGFIGRLFRTVGAHVPPPAGVRSPVKWGDEPYLVELFGTHAEDIRCSRRSFNFRYRSPAHWIEVFRNYYGPTHKAFAALDEAGQARLQAELVALLEALNIGGAESLVVPGEYLEVVITRH